MRVSMCHMSMCEKDWQCKTQWARCWRTTGIFIVSRALLLYFFLFPFLFHLPFFPNLSGFFLLYIFCLTKLDSVFFYLFLLSWCNNFATEEIQSHMCLLSEYTLAQWLARECWLPDRTLLSKPPTLHVHLRPW